MKASQLKGRAVISLGQPEKTGTVHAVICDPATQRVMGLKVKTGVLGGPKLLRAADIYSVGVDAVTITDRKLLRDSYDEAPELKSIPDFDDLTGTRVVSEGGTFLGTIADILVDMQSFQIEGYELSGSLWENLTRSQRTFSPQPGLRFGNGLLVVPDALADELAGQSRTEAGEQTQPPVDSPMEPEVQAGEPALYSAGGIAEAASPPVDEPWQAYSSPERDDAMPPPPAAPASSSTLYPPSAQTGPATDADAGRPAPGLWNPGVKGSGTDAGDTTRKPGAGE